jgi:hypothetical protein
LAAFERAGRASAVIVAEVHGALHRGTTETRYDAPSRDLGVVVSGGDEARRRLEAEGATGATPRESAMGARRGLSRARARRWCRHG